MDMDIKNASIAIATDDGVTVSSHFGRALFYEVLNLTDGKVVKRERREKARHLTFAPEGADGEHDHHHGEAHEQRHQMMTSSILDCQAVVVRRMGSGAVEHLREAKIFPILTSLHTIEEVVNAIKTDTLDNDPRRIHYH
jgi:predicted Fe-Mo cluster-binding NifX family protein